MKKENILALVSLGIAGLIAIGLIAGLKKGILMFPDSNTSNSKEPAESLVALRLSSK